MEARRRDELGDDVVGRVLGRRYRVLERLGRGGMGAVYRVEDIVSGTELALKQAHAREDADGVERTELRFRREFHSLVRLRHPRIVGAYEYGHDEHGAFYTMELLDGADLKDVGTVDGLQACRLLRDVAAALAFLHARNLIHRDLAPRNIRRTSDGRAKLIDFGLLATVGVSTEIAGTPAFIAPENLRGLPLDDRTDLYALGALGYWMVTGRHPYPARKLSELERLWRTAPVVPSAAGADVPPGYDDLVMALLCLDPLGRPSSAAEVIDRLQAIADLEPDPDLDVTEGYLASAAMVGRRREMELMRQCVVEASRGHGRAVVIEAATGTGKSRLLRELALEAQLGGAKVLTADAASERWGRYGVVHSLVRSAIEAVPDVVRQLDRHNTAVLARVFGDLAERLGPVPALERVAEPAEERMRVQRALTEWLLELCRGQPLAVLVDDLQRCDEASAAVLAALARKASGHSLLVAAALRTAEVVRAPQAVAAFSESDLRLRLRGLELGEVEDLVRSLFGDVQHAPRLSKWMYESTGGSPLHCTELARSLVERGTIRYVDGIWVLPMDVAADEAPPALGHAMDQRIGKLSDGARRLAEALAVHGSDMDLTVCHALAGQDVDEADLFAGIDELIVHGVLVGSEETYRFRHDGLREAVLRGLDDRRRATLHLRVARMLETAGVDLEREAEIGWHLRAGGRTQEAAEYLLAAGKRLFEVQALSDCVAPLEAALEDLERADADDPRLLEVRFMLVAAGWISDRAAGLRHMRSAVEAYHAYAGIRTAQRVGRVVGRHLGLIIGVSWACLRWLLTSSRRRGPNPIAALSTFAVTVGYAAGLEYANHDLEGLERLIEMVRPMGIMKGRMPHAAFVGMSAFVDLLMGRLAQARRKLEYVLDTIRRDRLSPMGEFEKRFAAAGIHSLIAQAQVTNLDPELSDRIEQMHCLDLRYYDLVAETTRVVGLRFRGCEREAQQLQRELEATSIQLGSWSTDIQLVLFSHPPYGMWGDIVNLKRMVDALERLVDEGFDYRARLAMTRGDYLRARGELDDAKRELTRALEILHPDERLTRQWVLAGLAETHLRAGEPEQARAQGEACLHFADDPEVGQASVRCRAERVIALALAELGDPASAERRLERLIADAERLDSPGAAGLAHEARARVALAVGDHGAYHLHCERAGRWLRPTGNPALVGALERLLEAGVVRGDAAHDVAVSSDTTTTVTTREPSSNHTASADLDPQRRTLS